jgi:DNA-binding CsgD family transcriptional regulator
MATIRIRALALDEDFTLVALGAVILLCGADIFGDFRSGASWAHIGGESVIMGLVLVGALTLWAQRQAARGAAAALVRDLEHANAQARRWEEDARQALHGLGEAVVRQFDRWELSPAEREVAVLLLKGLRHKEIGGLRGTSERTVRQQAFSVYRKAGLTSRTELAAFFLDAALLPALESATAKDAEPVSA